MFKKKDTKVSIPSRISKLSTPELIQWGDALIMQLGASFDGWRHHDDPHELVDETLSVLGAIWEELKSRNV